MRVSIRGLLVFILTAVNLLSASVTIVHAGRHTMYARDSRLQIGGVHNSDFAAIRSSASLQSCASTRAPQPLATPNPLLDWGREDSPITVSFIVGVDGRVHSPLILESSGAPEDRAVLEAVSSWRYRPATCNGVPTESEAKIAFSSR